jgi:hypothetical protein
MPPDFISRDRFTDVEAFALAAPPTLTRLEPQGTLGDPRPGIEARVHDPLWLLGRQWQLGEFEGEDAGTPLTVRAVTRTVAVDRWAPGAGVNGRAFGRDQRDLLEPLVEAEPVTDESPGLRARAEAAAALLAALDDAGLGSRRADFVGACPLDFSPDNHPDGDHAGLDPAWTRLVRLLRGRGMADAEAICQEFEDAGGGLPPWLGDADAAESAALLALVGPWQAWYRAEVSPMIGGEDAWVGDRLEYRFRIAAGGTVLEAPAHGGGDIDWHSFDAARADAPLAEPPQAPAPPADERRVHALLATPLRYPGMPTDRLWEMEDAQVNLGLVEAEPWDLARLLVAEFALTYGNDWLVVPVDVPFGSLTTIESLTYTTTFGERFVVRPTAAVSPDARWRMFAITAADGVALDGLLVPPGAVEVHDGPVFEEVLFMRDEMANMAWAVERSVQGPSGIARNRARERDDPKPGPVGPVKTAALDYLLQTGVPGRWIPYLPRSPEYRAIELVQGRVPAADGSLPPPLGVLLNRADTKALKDAEIPREGVTVRRQPSVTRLADGSYVRWTTRRTSVGRGGGASGLAFDGAPSRKARPNS